MSPARGGAGVAAVEQSRWGHEISPRRRGRRPAIKVGIGPDDLGITPSGKNLYVVNQFSGTVTVIRTSINAVIKNIHVGGQPDAVGIMP